MAEDSERTPLYDGERATCLSCPEPVRGWIAFDYTGAEYIVNDFGWVHEQDPSEEHDASGGRHLPSGPFDAAEVVAEARRDGRSALETLVFQALGFASVCWSEAPHGIFESDRAKDCGEQVVAMIRHLGGQCDRRTCGLCFSEAVMAGEV